MHISTLTDTYTLSYNLVRDHQAYNSLNKKHIVILVGFSMCMLWGKIMYEDIPCRLFEDPEERVRCPDRYYCVKQQLAGKSVLMWQHDLCNGEYYWRNGHKKESKPKKGKRRIWKET